VGGRGGWRGLSLLYLAESGALSRDGLLCSPIQNTGTVALDMVGAYVPGDVASGDTMDFPEQYAEVLYFYGMFYCYVSMPGMVEECLEAYKSYIRIVNLMVEDLASRFPSDQG